MTLYWEYMPAFIAGAIAGLSVDVTLYPLDTIKTRLQSAEGFRSSGGFKGIYSGIGSVLLGSAPGAALFFATYEATKHAFVVALPHNLALSRGGTFSHMVAAVAGEVVACLVRVPCEVVKQRAQSGRGSVVAVVTALLNVEGPRGLYRGYTTTVFREVPFSLIQFPLWEFLKTQVSNNHGGHVDLWQSAACGAVAGSVAAFATTPLDVAKTRIMLAKHQSDLADGGTLKALNTMYRDRGIRGLFSGVVPRVAWISIGGAIFLGGYDVVRRTLDANY